MSKTIITDGKGRPFVRPVREAGEDVGAYLQRFHAYKDAIAQCANAGFDAEWRKQAL